MTESPIKLVPPSDKIWQSSVERLQEFQALLESDDIVEIGVVGVSRDGTPFTGWSAGAKTLHLIGALRILEYQLLRDSVTD